MRARVVLVVDDAIACVYVRMRVCGVVWCGLGVVYRDRGDMLLNDAYSS